MLSDGYNTEQREITERLPIVKQEIEDLKAAATNVERFVDISNKYTDLRKLTPEVLRAFIERIIIPERTAKHSKTATQQIDSTSAISESSHPKKSREPHKTE